MNDFDDWFDKQDIEDWTNKKYMLRAYEAGVASRQGEVDALNALGEMSEQKVDDLVLRNTELQKRIDRVVHILTYTNHASTPLCDELGEILKGQNNG